MQILPWITKWSAPALLLFHFFIVAGILFLIFYVWDKRRLLYLKIQQKFPQKRFVFSEIKYSVYTSLIFAAYGWFVVWASYQGLTLIYRPIDKYGYGYFFLSLLLMIVIHDTYFYWTHRLLHWKPLFKKVHVVHHLSHNPTPFSAYSFHPVEAIIQGGVGLIVFIVPYHATSYTLFMAYALGMNILGHLGFEFLPRNFVKSKIGHWFNTPTHHNIHHQDTKYNYGLYFNLWDRFMKTNHPKYEERFEAVVDQRELVKKSNASGVVNQMQPSE